MDTEPPDISYAWCVDCNKYVGDAMAVAYAQGNSGPGKILHACIAHARKYAEFWFAPQWLKDDIAALDAAAGAEADVRKRGSA